MVDFFGYDVGTRTAVLTFEGQDPTAGGELLVETITFDVATRDSGNQLNESHAVDLSVALVGIAPHPKQGWHVKLTVNVDGAQGADVKHKTYWVSECAVPELVAAQAAVDLAYDTQVWTAAAQASQEQAAAATAAAAAASAATATAAQAAAAAVPAELPRTGTTSSTLAILATTLIACGAIVVGTAKTLSRSPGR